jgi:hypothetical protein
MTSLSVVVVLSIVTTVVLVEVATIVVVVTVKAEEALYASQTPLPPSSARSYRYGIAQIVRNV